MKLPISIALLLLSLNGAMGNSIGLLYEEINESYLRPENVENKNSTDVVNDEDYIIDVKNQQVRFYHSWDLEPQKEYVVSYESIRNIFPKDLMPRLLTNKMIFNTNCILKELGLIKDRFSLDTYNQDHVMAFLTEEEGKTYLNAFKLQYFQHRTAYYSISDAELKDKYIKYYGNHERAKPTIFKILLSNSSNKNDYSINYSNSNGVARDININQKGSALVFKSTYVVATVQEQWGINFSKAHSNLIKFREDDPLFKWRLFYENFSGARKAGNEYLFCEDYKCFKRIFNQHKLYEHDSISDLKNLIKYSQDLKKINFKKDYVPLFLSVSKEESAFYKNIAKSSFMRIESAQHDGETVYNIYSDSGELVITIDRLRR